MYQPIQPDFIETLDFVKKNVFSNLYSHNIGKIVKFYSDTQTADVQLMQVKKCNGQLYPATLLSKIPVHIYGCNEAQITLPNIENTICIILTFDRNISSFMKTGEAYEPETNRKHNITDSIALTTFFTLNNPIQNYDTTAITLIYSQTISEVLYTSYIKNYANKVEINVNNTAKVTINPTKIELDTEEVDIKATQDIDLKSNNGGNININSKIKIANTAYSLGTIIASLITVIKGITITGSAVSQTSKDALDTEAAKFVALLQ